jgi:epoxyqueuosine reductase
MTEKHNKIQLILPFKTKEILLHSCCAPCACSIMETLKKNNIEFTVFFYNPNIDTIGEYNIRKKENMKFAKKLNIKIIDGDYLNDQIKWQKYITGYENEPERGKRCSLCFEMRLSATAEYAYNNGFKVFTSSLGISRWKDFEEVSKCGEQAAAKYNNLVYWKHNWRKQGGSNRMSELTKEENFYQQQYCGCIYSKY